MGSTCMHVTVTLLICTFYTHTHTHTIDYLENLCTHTHTHTIENLCTHTHAHTLHRVWVILLCVNATASNATTSLKLPHTGIKIGYTIGCATPTD